jgi:hypothetical protein
MEIKNHKFELNPKVRDFIETNNSSLLGLGWACYWRMTLTFVGAYLLVAMVLVSVSSFF